MLEWFKDRISLGTVDEASEKLRAHFAPVETLQAASKNMAQRIARFVLTGEDEAILRELTALRQAALVLGMSINHYGGGGGKLAQSLPGLEMKSTTPLKQLKKMVPKVKNQLEVLLNTLIA